MKRRRIRVSGRVVGKAKCANPFCGRLCLHFAMWTVEIDGVRVEVCHGCRFSIADH